MIRFAGCPLTRARRRALAVPIAIASAIAIGAPLVPANAHPGGHAQMSWLEFARHYTEPDHLAFLALAVLVGWLAFRWGRRIEARAQRAASKRERDRP